MTTRFWLNIRKKCETNMSKHFFFYLYFSFLLYQLNASSVRLGSVRSHFNENDKVKLETTISRTYLNRQSINKIIHAFIECVFNIRYGPKQYVDVRDSLIHYSFDVENYTRNLEIHNNYCTQSYDDDSLILYQNILETTIENIFTTILNVTLPSKDIPIVNLTTIIHSYENSTQHHIICESEENKDESIIPIQGVSFAKMSHHNNTCHNTRFADNYHNMRKVGGSVFNFDMGFHGQVTELYYAIAFSNNTRLHEYHMIYSNEYVYIGFSKRKPNKLHIVFGSVKGQYIQSNDECRSGVNNNGGVVCVAETTFIPEYLYIIKTIYNTTTNRQTAFLLGESGKRIGSIIIGGIYKPRTRTTLHGIVDNNFDSENWLTSCCAIPLFDILVMCPFGENITCSIYEVGEFGGVCSRDYVNFQTKTENITIAEKYSVNALYLHRGWL